MICLTWESYSWSFGGQNWQGNPLTFDSAMARKGYRPYIQIKLILKDKGFRVGLLMSMWQAGSGVGHPPVKQLAKACFHKQNTTCICGGWDRIRPLKPVPKLPILQTSNYESQNPSTRWLLLVLWMSFVCAFSGWLPIYPLQEPEIQPPRTTNDNHQSKLSDAKNNGNQTNGQTCCNAQP